ncbi:uncharacterized protein [Centruroides vittatus]|uniref:uncharacterized protein n=1 Tax=Centruroides vittatus TaxID=120091 RepID=UPI00350F5635
MPRFQPDNYYLGILFLCVPLQYFLVYYWNSNEVSRTHAINQFIKNLVQFKQTFFHWSSWEKWCSNFLSSFWNDDFPDKSLYNSDDLQAESPAIEVMKFKQKHGYFASSPEPRNPRSPDVKYRIGQVIVHKKWNYRGVIIGWDEEAKAPEEWLKIMHGAEHPHWRKMPNYAILVDSRDRSRPQITYVPEENIEVVKNTRILNQDLEDYFEHFDGAQYIPRPWLRSLYPLDY